MSMVECAHCGRLYRLGDGEYIKRWGDCDEFRTPCCQRVVDTRSWKSFPDYERVTQGDIEARAIDGEPYLDAKGNVVLPKRWAVEA